MRQWIIFRIWVAFISILFSVAESKADNGLTFEAGKIRFAGIEMPYRVAHVSGNGQPALVIYLHGGSSKGNDNETQMKEAGIDSIANYLEKKRMNAVYIVPQCPSDKSWGGPMLGILKSLIDKYVEDGSVDKEHLYIFGGSMGGTGTWSLLSAYPGLFAAAMPVAGNPSKCDADKVALTPVYTVMGTSDQIMSVETTSSFIDELNIRNGITAFDVEKGWTHEMTCIQSYTSPRLDWVFGNHHVSSGIETTETGNHTVISAQYYSINGYRLPEPPCKGMYVVRYVYGDGTVVSLKKMN